MREISGETTNVTPPMSRAGNLIGHRFPGAGGHHAQAVAPRHHRLDDLELSRAEQLEYPNISFNTASARVPASTARDCLARAAASRNSSRVAA